MNMAAHDTPTINLKSFFFLTEPPTIKYDIFILSSDKQIDPMNDGKADKIHFTRISKLIFPTHVRSEEHTSELQSLTNLVCRLLLEKKTKLRISPLRPTGLSPRGVRHSFTARAEASPLEGAAQAWGCRGIRPRRGAADPPQLRHGDG